MRLNTRTGKVQFDKQEIRTLEKVIPVLLAISTYAPHMSTSALEARNGIISVLKRIDLDAAPAPPVAEKEPVKK